MSAKDWTDYAALARRLVGTKLALSLPTNSLKLMADERAHGTNYLWVDPPWDLLRAGVREIGAADYPDPDGPDYPARHEAWGARVRPLLDGGVLLEVESVAGGGTAFHFQNGVSLVVAGVQHDLDETSWYDNWYATGDGWPQGGALRTSPG